MVLERWPFSFDPGASRFTTVMLWKTDVTLPMIDGVRHGGKNVEFHASSSCPGAPSSRSGRDLAPRPRSPAGIGWHLVTLGTSRRPWTRIASIWHNLGASGAFRRTCTWRSEAAGSVAGVPPTWRWASPWWSRIRAGARTTRPVPACSRSIRLTRRWWRSRRPMATTGVQCDAARAVAESAFASEKVLERLLADCDLT